MVRTTKRLHSSLKIFGTITITPWINRGYIVKEWSLLSPFLSFVIFLLGNQRLSYKEQDWILLSMVKMLSLWGCPRMRLSSSSELLFL
jgi:hypothetical protein